MADWWSVQENSLKTVNSFAILFFSFVAQKPYNLPNTNFGAIKSKALCDCIFFFLHRSYCWSDSINLMNGVIIGPGVSQVWMCENKYRLAELFFHVFGEKEFVKYYFPLFFYFYFFIFIQKLHSGIVSYRVNAKS